MYAAINSLIIHHNPQKEKQKTHGSPQLCFNPKVMGFPDVIISISSMSARCQGHVAESVFDSLDVPLTYENISISVQLNEELMGTSVLDIKKFLLSFHPALQDVKDLPEQLALYAVFSNDVEQRKELSDQELMVTYRDVLVKCQQLVLERMTSP